MLCFKIHTFVFPCWAKQITAITVTERRRWNVCKFSLLNFIVNWLFNLHKVIVFVQTCCSSPEIEISVSNAEEKIYQWKWSNDEHHFTFFYVIRKQRNFRNQKKIVEWVMKEEKGTKAAFKRLFSSFNFPWWHIKNLSFLLHHEQFNKFSHSILKASPTATSHTYSAYNLFST
jgi:hypothetical protein